MKDASNHTRGNFYVYNFHKVILADEVV